jgi:hypothetical protein
MPLWLWLGAWCCGTFTGLAQTAAAPVIVQQPVGTVVYTGQNARLEVVATGNPTPTYQWLRNNSELRDRRDPVLVLTNVTTANAGNYSVRVSNSQGRVTSAAVSLTVLPLPLPTLVFRSPEVREPDTVLLPLEYVASGQEVQIGFSVEFRPEALEAPEYVRDCLPAATASATVPSAPLLDTGDGDPAPDGLEMELDASEVAEGRVGFRWTRGGEPVFGPGQQCLGFLRFRLRPDAHPMDSGFAPGTQPVPSQITLTTGITNQIFLRALPPSILGAPQPAQLDPQTGLMLQRLQVGFAGAAPLPQGRILVRDLGRDSLDQPIRVQNAVAFIEGGQVPVLVLNELQPGELRTVIVEFYVADLQTRPSPSYLTDPFSGLNPPGATPFRLPIARTLALRNETYPDGALLVEFSTRQGFSYLIQYAPTLEGLDDSEVVRAAFPVITGTGGPVQWIDGGPPKTLSPPGASQRFYRVTELR